jgi:hypothetical protein
MEAIRSLKRRLSDVLYRQLIADTRTQQTTLAKVAEASPLT